MRNKKKEPTFEIDLLPVFAVLSVCICFLLMTAVWVQAGSMNTKQASGGQSQAETKELPSAWFTFDANGDVKISFKHIQKRDISIRGRNNSINLQSLNSKIQSLDSSIEMALLVPAANTSYDEIIQTMDLLRGKGIKDVGISPL